MIHSIESARLSAQPTYRRGGGGGLTHRLGLLFTYDCMRSFLETRDFWFYFFNVEYPPSILPPGMADNLEVYREAILINDHLLLLKTCALTDASPWVKVIYAAIVFELKLDLESCTSRNSHFFYEIFKVYIY